MANPNNAHQIDRETLSKIPTPCWLLQEDLLEENLKLLSHIKEQTGAKILLALKAYSLWDSFELISQYLDGCCASGLHEAILSKQEFKKETHTYSPAFIPSQIDEIASISNHIVFNSRSQLLLHASQAKISNPAISTGIRVNPELSLSPAEQYSPCAPYSRLGIKSNEIDEMILKNIDGLHFHALCEQGSDSLELVLASFEDKFGSFLHRLQWVNFGGGHLITSADYDVTKLISIINRFKSRYPNLTIYLEPGEAVAWQTGVLVASVLDIVHNDMDIAILDISAESHMPDTIIMPYRAEVAGASVANDKQYTYRLAGNSCLAGDIMGDYSFDTPLCIGDKIIFQDQMHYTMVKSTTFNGIPLPSIAILRKNGELKIIKEFTYQDFKNRLS